MSGGNKSKRDCRKSFTLKSDGFVLNFSVFGIQSAKIVMALGHLFLFAHSWDNETRDLQELGQYATSRNSRVSECREIDAVQCSSAETAGTGGQLSVCDD